MKCEKCGNEYSSNYYFEAPNICKECFSKMADEEKQSLQQTQILNFYNETNKRVGFGYRLGAILIDYAIIVIVQYVVFMSTGFFENVEIFMEMVQDIVKTNPEMVEQDRKSVV